ncbi:hypothetical protein JI435_022970, partial [Parastagonospora nodorum SN15]
MAAQLSIVPASVHDSEDAICLCRCLSVAVNPEAKCLRSAAKTCLANSIAGTCLNGMVCCR